MKKILALLILVFSIASCGKDSETAEQIVDTNEQERLDGLKELLDKFGIKPSDWQKINVYSFKCVDSISYKLAWGQQDTCAWIAKFQPDGTEIWNYKYPIKYSETYRYISPTIINDIVIFITHYVDPNDYKRTYMSTINFTSGNVIFQKELKNEIDNYNFDNIIQTVEYLSNYYKLTIGICGINYLIDYDGKIFWEGVNEYLYPCLDNIFIYWHAFDTNYFMYTLINKKGEIIWQRGPISEKEEGWVYGNGKILTFLDNEKLFFKRDSPTDDFKIINIKEYTLLYTLPKEQLPLKGDNFEKENISYQWDTCYIKNNNIHLIYNENKTIISSPDPISGASTYEIKTIGKYYYDIDKDTYQVVGNGKLE